jgi:hypothetical protein
MKMASIFLAWRYEGALHSSTELPRLRYGFRKQLPHYLGVAFNR